MGLLDKLLHLGQKKHSFPKHTPKLIAISHSSSSDNNILYNWLGRVSGVTHQYNGIPAQQIISTLNCGDEVHLGIFSESPDKIAVLSSREKQIGWFEGNHYNLLLERLKSNEPIYAFVDEIGKVNDPTKDITWVSVRIHLYKTESDKLNEDKRREEIRLEKQKYREISKSFQGTANEYCAVAQRVLEERGYNPNKFHIIKKYSTEGWIQWGENISALILNIKATGDLKYWLVNYPIEKIKPYIPDSIECVTQNHKSNDANLSSTRIYIQKPNDLELMADLLCALCDPVKANLRDRFDWED